VNPVLQHAPLAVEVRVCLFFLRVGKHVTISTAHAPVCGLLRVAGLQHSLGDGLGVDGFLVATLERVLDPSGYVVRDHVGFTAQGDHLVPAPLQLPEQWCATVELGVRRTTSFVVRDREC
jgi:hypothetical protein